MSVPITYRQKMDFGSCVQMVGFPKYGHIYIYIYINVSFIAVAMNSRDRYEIIGLCEISHFLKQPCRNFCLE